MIENGLSIDVDDFVSTFSDSYNISTPQTHISKDVDRVLKLLKPEDIQATFLWMEKEFSILQTLSEKSSSNTRLAAFKPAKNVF